MPESLLVEVKERENGPLGLVIDIFGATIEDHENRDCEFAAFKQQTHDGPPETAMHRLLYGSTWPRQRRSA